MDNITVNRVTTTEKLNELYDCSALTFLGLTTSQESLNAMFDWIREYTAVKTMQVFVVTGRTMNNQYGLTGTNAYADDLSIVCVKLTDLENPMKLALPRFQVGGMWFDDVVDNNARRENRDGGEE